LGIDNNNIQNKEDFYNKYMNYELIMNNDYFIKLDKYTNILENDIIKKEMDIIENDIHTDIIENYIYTDIKEFEIVLIKKYYDFITIFYNTFINWNYKLFICFHEKIHNLNKIDLLFYFIDQYIINKDLIFSLDTFLNYYSTFDLNEYKLYNKNILENINKTDIIIYWYNNDRIINVN
jgi:hypothetical protein